MNRRSLLASLGAGCAAGTGCLSSPRSGGPRTTTAPSGRETATTRTQTRRETATQTTTVDGVVRTALGYVYNSDHLAIEAPERDAFCLLRLPTRMAGPPSSAFELRLAGERHSLRGVPGFDTETPGVGAGYREGDTSGWLFADVPAVEATTATLVGPSRTARVPTDVIGQLATLPSFSLAGVETPETAPRDVGFEVSVTVRNDGDRAGYWLGAVQHGVPFYRLSPLVPAGDEQTRTVSVTRVGADTETARVVVRDADVRRTYEVPYESTA